MKKNIGMLLLGIYLILIGAMGLFGASLGQLHLVVPLLALVGGIFLIIGK